MIIRGLQEAFWNVHSLLFNSVIFLLLRDLEDQAVLFPSWFLGTRPWEPCLLAEWALALLHPQSHCNGNMPPPLIPFMLSLVFLKRYSLFKRCVHWSWWKPCCNFKFVNNARILACSSSHQYPKRWLFLTHSLRRINLFPLEIFSFVVILISNYFYKKWFFFTVLSAEKIESGLLWQTYVG